MPQRSKSDLLAENKFLRQKKASDGIISIINNAIKWVGIVLLFRYGFLSINALAGQSTYSNIMVSFITDMKINQWLAYVIGIGGFVYGKSQSSLRKKTVQRLSTRTTELETMIDPGRTTSGLTTAGDTHPEDRT